MATIIKAADSASDPGAAAFHFDDVRERTSGYLDQVRAQAALILDAARREAVALAERARAEGSQAAQAEAQKAVAERLSEQTATLLPALGEAIRSIEESKQSWLLHWEHSAVHLACQIAARVLRREQREHPEVALPLVREALELAVGSPEIHVHLSPADYEALGGQVRQLSSEIARLGQTKVVSDAAITPGGCRIHTRFGTIDQQFEAQLARIEQELS